MRLTNPNPAQLTELQWSEILLLFKGKPPDLLEAMVRLKGRKNKPTRADALFSDPIRQNSGHEAVNSVFRQAASSLRLTTTERYMPGDRSGRKLAIVEMA